MNRSQAEYLRASFRSIQPCGAALIARVFRNLADSHPGVRALFPDDTSDLNQRLFDTLGQVVRNVHKFNKLQEPLSELGLKAARAGANLGHYRIIKHEMLDAIEQISGDDWNDDLAWAWSETLDAVTGVMLAGGQESPAQIAA
jgi:hemoglobin-like flavoprotein